MKKVKIIINTKKPGSKKLIAQVKRLLKKHRMMCSSRPDFIMAIGGDGTMLAAAHRYGRTGIPILGVNSGGLGFLTDITLDELDHMLADIVAEKYTFETRMVIQGKVGTRYLYGLNDLTIVTRVPGRAVEFSAVINGEYICRFIADGIVISTPTGSTAYSLATGGPILLPHTEALIVTPIAPHTLSVRPIVLPADSVIEIQVGTKGRAQLVADGQLNNLIRMNQKVIFKKAAYKVKLIKSLHTSFFSTLREKMKWGGREHA
jgi:NAD+ kinase